MQPIADWGHGVVKPLQHYVLVTIGVCAPFVLGFIICSLLFRRQSETRRKSGDAARNGRNSGDGNEMV